MRKMITIMVLVLALLLNSDASVSQEKDNHDHDNSPGMYTRGGKVITISYCLAPLINEYLKKCALYGIDASNILELDFIPHMDTKLVYNKNLFGVTNFGGKNSHVVIDLSVQHHTPTFLKAVLYHELYHALFKKEGGHLGPNQRPYILRRGRYVIPETVIKTFDKKAEDEYFKFIKDKQDKLKK